MLKVIKKDNSLEEFDKNKIKNAVAKAAFRCDKVIDDNTMSDIVFGVVERITTENVTVAQLHEIVIGVLRAVGLKDVSESYAEYRYYKTNYAKTFEKLRQDADDVLRLGDRENANFDSSLVSTKGSLIKGYLTKSLYKQFYLSKREKELIDRGDIYIHDMRDMILGSFNCLEGTTWVVIREKGEISTIRLDDLRERLGVGEGVFSLRRGIQILSRNGWVALEGISVRKIKEGEPLYRIHLRNGLELKATANHRIPVTNEAGEEVLKHVKEINVGDSMISMSDNTIETNDDFIDLCDYADEEKTYIGSVKYLKRFFEYKYGDSLQSFCRKNNIDVNKNLISMRLSEFKKLKKLIQIPYDVYMNLTIFRPGAAVKIPLILPVTDELARMFGYVFADGCVAKSGNGCYQVNFSSTKPMLLADFAVAAETAFPDVHVVRREPTEACTTPCTAITLCNGVVWDLFRKYKKGAYFIEIPNFIMNGSEAIKYNFLSAAMDCDGNYNGEQTSYSTVAPKYAEQFVLLLQSLGHHPTITKDHSSSSIYKAHEIVGRRNYDLYHVRMSQYEDQKKFMEKTEGIRKAPNSLRERRSVPQNCTKITKITQEYPEDIFVYDLQTEDSWFIANGYVVHNCCLFDMATLMKGGFEMSNVKYTEPKSVLSALQVIGDVTLVASAQQFGGFTIPEIDKTLLPYCNKTFFGALKFFREEMGLEYDEAKKYAYKTLARELRQGFQSIELKLNTVPSSRGDFAFTTLTFGQWDYKTLSDHDCKVMKMIGEAILTTRKNGHGENHQPVVFPKLVFLYDKNQIANDEESKALFDIAVETSASCMYPDYLSLTSEYGTVSKLYKETGAITSPMGCRAYLSPWANEEGQYLAIGRCNIGAVSLNIPLIIKVAQIEHPNDWKEQFWQILDDRLEVIRSFLAKRYEFISKQKASSNPLCFTQGGLYEGFRHPDEEIGDLIRYMTASFGVTALDEATYLWTGKRLIDDETHFATEILKYLNKKIGEFKKQDGHLYAIYGTPAESLCATQAKQYAEYCKSVGADNVFAHTEHYSPEYFTNSFHVNVTEEITPFEKQDFEQKNFHLCEGGHIGYVRLDNPENIEAVKQMIIRGMEMGFYQGVNFDSAYCQDCGKHSTNVLNKCPHCGSHNISVISRVCGYLGYSNVNGHSRMNDGKMCEIYNRKSM
jgi:ribonucleoside-triphosphate reductase